MQMLEFYFKNKLAALGYPGQELKIGYSLGYCQGDGMAFYGGLNTDDLKCIAERLYAPEAVQGNAYERVRLLRYRKLVLEMLDFVDEAGNSSVTIIDNSAHYHHFNTMTLSWEFDACDALDQMDEKDDGDRERAKQLQSLWEQLMTDLEEDIVTVSMRLEREGYKLIESGPYEQTEVWRYETARYAVVFSEAPPEDVPVYDMDEDADMSMMEDLINGKLRQMSLLAKVLDIDTEEELGRACLCGVTMAVPMKDTRYDGYRRELVSEAIDEAREALGIALARAA